ncbi:MAG: hypothetical protein OEZ06_32480, partial [Myxococcales bacterium]|nr:hypothetical protein [Myxococcales bacterium]
MRDPIRVLWRCAIAASSMLLFNACADEADAPEVGVAVVKLENVPEGVSCVRVRAVGVTSSEQRADVATGDTVELLMEGLPLGATDFYGSAFDIPCKEVTGGSSAAWVGGPEMAVVTPAAIVEVKLVLRPNGKSLVQVQFETGATGEPCVGPEAGCLDPADAVGSADDPAPDGAIMVSPSEFADGLNNGGNILASPRIDAAQKTAEQQEDDLNLGLVKDLLANDPEALDRLLRAPVEDDRLQLMPDGNYRLVLADPGPDGAPQEVITMGSRFALAEAAAGLTEFGTYDNQLTIYQQLHQLLPKEYMATANLPLPDEVAKLSAGEILRINRGIEADIGVILGYIQLPDLPPVGYPQSCADEEGTPPGGPYLDQTNGGCKPAHIFDLHRFPLKWRATCVKNQRNRGTCVAFGITAAVETKIA